ncbi:26s proteasome non-atpase regulatory subunit 14 [Anaeramoeba flamelloides]|uniref:26s proteasome non-atpase regulatory subunit 14 n=1 Tax=Anaeramoeba flamelloides TaxID=1746091 RepID=A0AAV7ZZV8_9EUKA|nr:26s proteasome non-atpase regulatory subunit 14 [Anaeramoeba flamelloides]KAJ6239863.1 26s proteasome non-atpase regulatory subunit 14 [Anaeramoeba flamelloides]
MDFSSMLQGLGGQGQGQGSGIDMPQVDTSETIYVSSLALLKMLKHGRSGIPMEVMGLMLGKFVDEYTVRVDDVFASPQIGTTTSVETHDNVFQTKMIEMLKQTGRGEDVVGWYHSHPGFGPWLSGVDMQTQQSFETLNKRSVAVVIDPVQSVKGKVVIDAFRLIPQQAFSFGKAPRQTTSHLGDLQPPSMVALVHGLNRYYYSMPINYRKNEFEQKMLLNLEKKSWIDGLNITSFENHSKKNSETLDEMIKLSKQYNLKLNKEKEEKEKELEEKEKEKIIKERVKKRMEKEKDKLKKEKEKGMEIEKEKNEQEENKNKKEEKKKDNEKNANDKKKDEKDKKKKNNQEENKKIKNVGLLDPKRHLKYGVEDLMANTIIQSLGTMLLTEIL